MPAIPAPETHRDDDVGSPAAFRPAVRALGAVLALLLAVAGPASAQADCSPARARPMRPPRPRRSRLRRNRSPPATSRCAPMPTSASRRTSSSAAKGRDPSKKLGCGTRRPDSPGSSSWRRRFENEDLKQLAAIRLESLDNHWKFYQRELDDWRAASSTARRGPTRKTRPNSPGGAARGKRRVTAMLAGGVTPALTDRVNVIIGAVHARGTSAIAAARRTAEAAPARQHRAVQHRRWQEGCRRGDRLLRPPARHDRCGAGLEGLERHSGSALPRLQGSRKPGLRLETAFLDE